MRALYFLFLTVLIIIAGCSVTDNDIANDEIMELQIPDDFEFLTEDLVDLSIQLETSNYQPVSGINYQIFYVNANGDYRHLMNTVTDEQGEIKRQISVPAYVQKLLVRGFMNEFELDIIDNAASYYLGPDHGYSFSNNFTPPINQRSFITLPGVTYNPAGVPSPREIVDISPELLARINNSLPEYISVTDSHPEYLSAGVQTNFVFTDYADVWVTFVAEGANYRNSLGFYTYNQDTGPPADPSSMDHYLVFPNCSYPGYGGSLESGTKVYLGTFDPGTVMGWFLVQNGWDGGGEVDETDLRLYSNKEFNPEAVPYNQHSVLLFDDDFDTFVVGFEDIVRPDGDQDFNDAVFLVDANPITNIDPSGIPALDIPPDDDGDGISNPADDYPDDPSRAFDNYYPSQQDSATIVFEDKWPLFGDYDMNDLVMNYHYTIVTNASNEIVEIQMALKMRAAGASFDNKFAVEVPFDMDVNGSNLMPFGATGTPVSIPFVYSSPGLGSNTIVEMGMSIGDILSQSGFYNTVPDDIYRQPHYFYVTMVLGNPQPFDSYDDFPYNPFLIKQNDPNLEIHLLNHPPSFRSADYAINNLFGTYDDASDPAQNKYYVAANGLPWALNFPENWYYPAEKISITDVYYNFAAWAESGGTAYTDWYHFDSENVDLNKVYIEP